MTGTLRRLSLQAAALALAVSAAPLSPAAARQTKKPAPRKQGAGPARPSKGEAARADGAEARRSRERREAAAVILEVAAAAKGVEDLAERYALLTDCADALWPADEPAACLLFRRAWEAAGEADVAAHEARPEGPDATHFETRARAEVAAAAARRDARLAEEFLAALREGAEKQNGAGEDDKGDGGSPRRRPAACNAGGGGGYRRALADSLLEDGEAEAAAQVAAPAASCAPDAAFVLFLLRLRAQLPERAHALYLRALEAMRADPAAHVNAALAAAAYVGPPGLMLMVDEKGYTMAVSAGAGADRSGRPVPPRVRAAFYDSAAAVLLRPPSAAAAAGQTPAALYFAVNRLLPLFESEAARHAPALHARRAALAAEVEPARRALIEQQAAVRRLAAENPTDPLRPYLERIEGAATSPARDDLRLSAARNAARRRLWERARQLARDIEDEDKRRSARLVVGAYQVAALDEAFADPSEQDVESAAGFVRAAELPAALRALGLARAASLADRRGDRRRALELLDEALARAAEADPPLRAAASLLAAEQAARFDSPRVWEALAAAVRAVNSEGSEGPAAAGEGPGAGEAPAEEAETLAEVFGDYSLEAVFEAVAARDFARSLAEARSVKDEAARSRSLVAAARAVVERAKAAPPARRKGPAPGPAQ